jgi:hypothetical protein
MDIPFPATERAHAAGPLGRFLPPLEPGMTARALADLSLRAGLAFDPFGSSPRLVLEAARAGWAVLVACNNPVTRFVLESTLQPPSQHELQAVLARLASSTKDHQRLEPFMLDLYATDCPQCAGHVSAEYFIWDRDLSRMVAKGVICPHCRYAGEDEAGDLDRSRAEVYTGRGLQQALALEQVAPAEDPDREHAVAALEVYPSRALYALVTLITKTQQLGLSGEAERAGRALLLSVMDAGNSLWGMPEGRLRPRQLVASPRYREINLWRALELAVEEWDLPDPGLQATAWDPRNPPAPGAIALFAGPARSLFRELNAAPPDLVLSVPPRPNQAYWTLSALWAAWLWGRGEAAAIKVALRRRRYDWAWHQSALRGALNGLAAAVPPGTPVLGLVPECEPGYLAAVLAAMDADGFRLTGRALRLAEAEACLRWTADAADAKPLLPKELPARLEREMGSHLQTRGEPASFFFMHAAAVLGLAGDRLLGSLPESDEAPVTSVVYQSVERALADRRTFTHLSTGSEPESGSYWLTEPAARAEALSDQVEALVLGTLRQERPLTAAEVDAVVCERLTGLRTPDRRWVLACLRSYAQADEASGRWSLRPEDRPEPRARDCAEIRRLLLELGVRLGYLTLQEEALGIDWINPDAPERPAYSFQVCETSPPSAVLASGELLTFVIPGGRAALLAEKARRDLRLHYAVEDATRVLKFRHVRRLAQESTLRRESLPERLALDPLGEQDPQLPLL